MMSSSAKFRYSYDVGGDWSEQWAFPAEASIKKLIHQEMSRKPSTRQNVPNIVARLMGVDVLPAEARSAVHPIKKIRDDIVRSKSNNNNGDHSVKKGSSISNPSKQQFSEPIYYDNDIDRWNSSQDVEKPKRREHPQEEELQKFKKDFEAWQAARFRECSRFAQVEDINLCGHNNKKSERVVEQQPIRYSCGYREKQSESPLLLVSSRRAKGRVSGAGPTTIVVLKPGPDRIWSSDDSRTSYSGSSEERGSMEDFLEEVKERLNREVQGKAPPFSPEPQQGTKQMAKKVRESSMGLIRSESTRSYRSEIHSSPDVDTRKLLAERLRNVLGNERPVMKHLRRPSYWENVEEEEIQQARSFRHDPELSPKNLVRSLSAPVSGTSFGKLLLEDRHVVTGAHIRRKHESVKNLLVDARKERFSFRERVRSTFTLRGRLFRRRMQQHSVAADLQSCHSNFMNDIRNGPTVISNRNEIYENSTEVPPSPASVCSSVQEEFWRPRNNLSPLSSADTTPADIDDAEILPDFAHLNADSSELQRQQLDQPESNITAETSSKHDLIESKAAELEDEALSFVRAMLIASGIYGSSSQPYLSRWDSFGKMIDDSVFEQVEESYKLRSKETDHYLKTENGEVDHKVLHDLVNEALLLVLQPPVMFSRKVSGCDLLPHPHGQKLLNSVWGMIRANVELPRSSLDEVVARDMESAPWSRSLDAEVIVGEIEAMILADIVNEIVKRYSLSEEEEEEEM